MINHKLVLENDFQEEFSLIAIHCSEEPYKMAYMINKQVVFTIIKKETRCRFLKQWIRYCFSYI